MVNLKIIFDYIFSKRLLIICERFLGKCLHLILGNVKIFVQMFVIFFLLLLGRWLSMCNFPLQNLIFLSNQVQLMNVRLIQLAV